jgi:hypothetical protein
MKKLLWIPLALLFLICMATGSQAQVADHALPKFLTVAAAPVIHPKRTVKQIAGSVLFATEEVVDVAHLGLDSLDKAFEALDKNNEYFGALYKVVDRADDLAAKVDSGLESAEFYFFGNSN